MKNNTDILHCGTTTDKFPHIHGCIIALCTAGHAIVSVNFSDRLLRKGDMTIIFMDISFKIKRRSSDFSCDFIHFPSDLIEDVSFLITSVSFWDFISIFSVLGLDTEQTKLAGMWMEQTRWLMSNLNDASMATVMRNQLYNLFISVDESLDKAKVYSKYLVNRSHGWSLANKYFALVVADYKRYHDVGYYVTRLAITSDYLYKLCRKYIKCSPKELIDSQLIAEIKRLLLDTDLNLKAIAAELHFEDTSYMCRFFRRLTGQSPTEFRQQNA